jgi:hypothetical protein
MAHLITVTNSDTKEDLLFNLDTVVSIEEGSHNTIITTRWGRTMVKDSLNDILKKSKSSSQGEITANFNDIK